MWKESLSVTTLPQRTEVMIICVCCTRWSRSVLSSWRSVRSGRACCTSATSASSSTSTTRARASASGDLYHTRPNCPQYIRRDRFLKLNVSWQLRTVKSTRFHWNNLSLAAPLCRTNKGGFSSSRFTTWLLVLFCDATILHYFFKDQSQACHFITQRVFLFPQARWRSRRVAGRATARRSSRCRARCCRWRTATRPPASRPARCNAAARAA